MIPADEIKKVVRGRYGRISTNACCVESACRGPATAPPTGFIGPALGCGSPLAYADVQPGETVLDLGSGAGRDVLLAARQVGPAGRVVGVDMTPEMVGKARENARRVGIGNAEFYLADVEHLPLPDASVDVVISNCVINLVPDKLRVFREAYRVMRPGGRFVVADIVATGPLPDKIRADPDAWAACIAGAIDVKDYLALIRQAGFRDVTTMAADDAAPGQVFSVTVRAVKPAEPAGG